jgi:glycosyltransferase involved in cell wall biosynthesis
MRIAVNLTDLRPGRAGGVETYVRNLIEGFARLPDAHAYHFLTNSETGALVPTADQRFTACLAESWLPKLLKKSKYVRFPWQWLAMSRELRRYRPDAYLCPLTTPLPPWHAAENTILTLHDIKHITNPELLNIPDLRFWEYFLRRGMKWVRKYITVSEYAKGTIVDCLPIDPDRVRVVYNGIDTRVFHNRPIMVDRTKFSQLPSEFIILPAATWPYKNHVRLLQAMALLRDTKRINIHLVLTGFVRSAHQDVRECLEKNRLEGLVSWLGWISSEELAYIYQQARALVFPSLHEGFGLPIIEAMACGCPVLCSNTTSCGEVAGGAALTCDPLQVEEIAANLVKIWTDSQLRVGLIQKGLVRAKDFTCERMAEETLKVFASV